MPPPARSRPVAYWLVACLDGIVFDRVAGANAALSVDRDGLAVMTQRLVRSVLPVPR